LRRSPPRRAGGGRRGGLPAIPQGASVYLCGRRLRNKRPKENREDGCPGGYMACDECAEVVSKFLDEAHNAKAVRKEWL
jgi:hypothetical protein